MPLWRARNTSMADDEQKQMTIETVYALPDKQWLLTTHLPYGATIQNAINAPGILDQVPKIDLTRNKVGVFGRVKPLGHGLHEGDRVEFTGRW